MSTMTSYLISSYRGSASSSSAKDYTFSWVDERLGYVNTATLINSKVVVNTGSMISNVKSVNIDTLNKTITAVVNITALSYSIFDIFICIEITYNDEKYFIKGNKIKGISKKKVTSNSSYPGLFYAPFDLDNTWTNSDNLYNYFLQGSNIRICKEGTNPSYTTLLALLGTSDSECSYWYNNIYQIHRTESYIYIYKFTTTPPLGTFSKTLYASIPASTTRNSVVPTKLILNLQGAGGRGGDDFVDYFSYDYSYTVAGGGGGSGAFASIVIDLSVDWLIVIGLGYGKQPSGISSSDGFPTACFANISISSGESFTSVADKISNCVDYISCGGGHNGTIEDRTTEDNINYKLGVGGSGGTISSSNTHNYYKVLYSYTGNRGGNGGYYKYNGGYTRLLFGNATEGTSYNSSSYSTKVEGDKIIPTNKYSWSNSPGTIITVYSQEYFPSSGSGGASHYSRPSGTTSGDGGKGGRGGAPNSSTLDYPVTGTFGSGGGGMIRYYNSPTTTPIQYTRYVGDGGNGFLKIYY